MANESKKRAKPSWMTATLGTLLGAAVVAGGMFSIAYAISTSTPMELDGNANDDLGGGSDWETELPLDGGGEVFIVDQVPPLATEKFFHGGGSKDDSTINKWGLLDGNATNPNKNNITNAYAKAKSQVFPASDMPGHPAVAHEHLIVYFGADRYDNEGDAALGFWFFENKVSVSGNGFTGVHSDKDILVQVDYVNGGARAEIQVFKWQGDGTGTHGSPKVLKQLGFGAADDETVCNEASGNIPANVACATTNNGLIDEFWDYTPLDPTPAGKMPARSFFEGAVDITALIGQVCISSFMAETRSSHSETAQLKDFALGDFDLCSVKVAKQCLPESRDYDSTNDVFVTEHTVTITNDGFGGIFDVQFKDTSVTGDGSSNLHTTCDIVKIGGVVLPEADQVQIVNNTTFYQVADSLASGESLDVGLLCESPLNSFANSVTVKASASDGGTPIPATADDVATESADNVLACHLDVEPLLEVTKACKGLSINATTFKPQVCATITVTNPVASNQFIDIDSIKNYPGTGGVSGTGVSILAAFQTANGNSLVLENDGVPVSFDICYEPTTTDGGLTDPAEIKFSDTVEAIGTGRAADAEIKDNASTFCKLCPVCPTCPPPPS